MFQRPKGWTRRDEPEDPSDEALDDGRDVTPLVTPLARPSPLRPDFDAQVSAGLRQQRMPRGETGLSWWATKDRTELQAEAERRTRAMSATREGRGIVPHILGEGRAR